VAEPAPTARPTRTVGSSDSGAGRPGGGPPGPAAGAQLPATTAVAPAAARPSAQQRMRALVLDVPEFHRHPAEMVVEIVAVE